jgi:hypothetical protein
MVTHKVELVPVVFFRGMNRHLRGRHGENQPSVAGVHRCESESVPEESAIRRRVLTVHDYVRAEDHGLVLFPLV